MVFFKTFLLASFLLVAFFLFSFGINGQFDLQGFRFYCGGICLLGCEKILDYFVFFEKRNDHNLERQS